MTATVQDIFAPIPLIERGKSIVLGGDPKGKNILYTVGKVVIIRDVANPKKCDVYTEHIHKVTVAKYAHHGNYICSGDIAGKIRIWDTLDAEHKLKNEFRPFAGEIRDLVWGPENKRIGVCGQGSDKHAAVIMWDSGNKLGDINQVNKRGNSMDMKPTRPYRVIVGDDDFYVSVYEGPPFKSSLEIQDHSRFVNSVRYSPDGKYWVSGSSDGRIFLYDAKTSEKVGQFGDEKKGAHSGGIYSLAWSPDSKELLSASGDKSAKVWNVETRQEVAQFVQGKNLEDQQYSCMWIGDTLISVSLSGCFNYLDRNNPEKPLRVVHGHCRSISKMTSISGDKPCHVSGDITGKLLWWDTDNGEAHEFSGSGHSNKICGLVYDPDSKHIISVGWDDKVRYTCASSFDFSDSTVVGLDSQPKSVALAAGGCVVVNTEESIVLIKDKKKVSEVKHTGKSIPLGFAAHGNVVAVQTQAKGVKIYNIEGDSLVDSGTEIEGTSDPEVLSFSPDGSMLAVGYADKAIRIFMACDGFKKHGEDRWGHHIKTSVLAWSPDSRVLASTSMDASLRLWNIADQKQFDVQRAHSHSFIHAMTWMDNTTLLTAGDDCLTKVFKVTW